MEVTAIREALRYHHAADLDNRRKVLALSAIGLLDFSIISLYQTGVIRHLPDPPFNIFDSDQVNASKEAYQFGVPDGPISAVAYAVIMALAAASGSEASGRKTGFDVAMGAVIAGNTAGALYYLYDMIFKQKKICLYCLTGVAINIASAVIVAPTVKKGIRKLLQTIRS